MEEAALAERGDVLRLQRRLGFGSDDGEERVVVVQATRLNLALSTTVVLPLDPDELWSSRVIALRVSPAESGANRDLYALPTHLRVLPLDRVAPGRVGRLAPRTLLELDRKLRLVLGL